MSWFVTLQPAEHDGELIIYGLWGSDPNPPMLPTRFVDTAALERDYHRCAVPLQAGDLVIFDSGRHVHRVTPVGGQQPRLTFGGFLTVDSDRTQLAFGASLSAQHTHGSHPQANHPASLGCGTFATDKGLEKGRAAL